ncbi:hypothetical protein EV363DRAFT_467408 [Boletus edulis]|uniref:Uncharacterized protein n=1 Tax=Boletus edulis BED1 TaxID=1328754 RepID=A0AAD4GEH2_BOLED|nr:hypothetical protein EV363DRAFT_467408 [Boletus edulis]KAF8439912.1 hypothetical protein L210DRAFT_2188867 [Boletus edulis BED1]
MNFLLVITISSCSSVWVVELETESRSCEGWFRTKSGAGFRNAGYFYAVMRDRSRGRFLPLLLPQTFGRGDRNGSHLYIYILPVNVTNKNYKESRIETYSRSTRYHRF